jgi:hypothetical protein
MSNKNLLVFSSEPAQAVIIQLAKASLNGKCVKLDLDPECELQFAFNFLNNEIGVDYTFYEIQHQGVYQSHLLAGPKPIAAIRWDDNIEKWFDEIGYICYRIQEVDNHSQNLIGALERYGSVYQDGAKTLSHVLNETSPEIIYEQVQSDRLKVRSIIEKEVALLSV